MLLVELKDRVEEVALLDGMSIPPAQITLRLAQGEWISSLLASTEKL